MHIHPFRSLTKLGKHSHPIDKIAELNGLLSGIALYPQVIQAALTKNVDGLSLYTFLFIFINSIIWIFYAQHRSLPQVLISSLLNCAASGILLGLVLFYN